MAEVRQSLGRIVESAERAGEVIGRIKALVKKAPALKGRLDVNEAVCDVVSLTRSGRAAARRVVDHLAAFERQVLEDVPAANIRTFLRVLARFEGDEE